MYDLIVVGGGPVGCYLAYQFSKKGRKVLLLEEHKEIGKPLACSGHVSNLIWNFLDPSFKDGLVENKIKGAIFHTQNKAYLFKQKGFSYVINRIKLDKVLAKLARESGVEILNGHKFIDLVKTPSHLTIHSKSKQGVEVFKSKLLAGCDGALSSVRKVEGFSNPKLFLGIFCYIQEETHSNYVEVFPSLTKDFFAWKIPRGKRTEYGLASSNFKNLYNLFKSFLFKNEISKSQISSLHSGLIPIQFLKNFTSDRVFLAGDSCGLVKPFTGGGIVYGLTSAKIAASTISPDNPETLGKYERALKSALGREILIGGLISKVYSLPSPIQKILFKFGSSFVKTGHLDKPSTFINR